MQRTALINARFNAAHPTNSLAEAGVLVHMIDGEEGHSASWRPCPHDCRGCRPSRCEIRDRMSCSLIGIGNSTFILSTDAKTSNHRNAPGLVINPELSALRCSYPNDGATKKSPHGCGSFCKVDKNIWDRPNPKVCSHQPLRPDQLTIMLRNYAWRVRTDLCHGGNGGTCYNEVVLDSGPWVDNLPHTIEAFFYADFEECAQPGSACRRSVQAAHQRFIETYPEVAASTPILRLRVNNFTYSPFELVDD